MYKNEKWNRTTDRASLLHSNGNNINHVLWICVCVLCIVLYSTWFSHLTLTPNWLAIHLERVDSGYKSPVDIVPTHLIWISIIKLFWKIKIQSRNKTNTLLILSLSTLSVCVARISFRRIGAKFRYEKIHLVVCGAFESAVRFLSLCKSNDPCLSFKLISNMLKIPNSPKVRSANTCCF